MIVIAHNNGIKFLPRCLDSINESHLFYGETVAVIDTQSTCSESLAFLHKIHLNNLYQFPVEVHQTSGRNFDTGAYVYAINNLKSSHYYFLHDSLTIKDPNYFVNVYNMLNDNNVVPFVCFGGNIYDDEKQRKFVEDKYGTSDFDLGIFGPIFSVKRTVLDKIDPDDYLLPYDKWTQMGMERGWSVLFKKYRINIQAIDGWYGAPWDYYRSLKKECPRRDDI